MNNRTRLRSALLLAAALVFITNVLVGPAASFASTTTTLLSESFGSTSFPPAGWTVGPRNYGTSQPCSYASQPGWYRSPGNPGGVAGVGSAVCWTFGAYSQNCYGSPTYGPCTMTTPSMNLTGIAVSGDSQYVDFDIYMAASLYDRNSASYGNNMGHIVEVLNGTTVIQTYKAYGTSGDWTVYTGKSGLCLSDPSAYNSTIYWKHVRLPLGSNTGNMQLTFRVKMLATTCVYSYWYSESVAITNVKVTSSHYDQLTVNGPLSLNFGRIPYQTPSPVMYTVVTNNSIRTINLSNFQITGLHATDFTVVYAPSSVPVGVKDSIGVVFSPQGSGGRFGTLTYNTDADIPTSVAVALQGYGLQPAIAFPQTFSALFSKVRVRFGDSVNRSLIVQNTGEVPLHLYPASSTFVGDFPQFYSVSRWPASEIPPGAIDSIVLTFSPYAEGIMNAQVKIASDAMNGEQTLNLKGIGILPHLVVTTPTTSGGSSVTGIVDYGSIAMGDSVCRTIVLHNTGSDTLVLQKQIVTYGDYDFTFNLLSGSDVNLAPDATKLVNVCFKPLQRGSRMASLRFYTNISPMYPSGADSSQFLIQVTGVGVPYGKLAVSGMTNVSAVVGKSNCIDDTIWNSGAADLTITSIKLSGQNASLFTLSGATLPLTIPAGSFKDLKVCFDPAVRGLANASLDVTGTSADRTMTQSLSILGTGQVVCMDAVPNPVAFGSSTLQNMTYAKSGHDTTCITVTNCGDVPMSFTATLGNGTNTAYMLTTASTALIAPQATGSICVAYNPDSIGASTGSVTITPSESSLAPVSLPLGGVGAGVLIAPSGQPANTAVGSTSTFTVTLTNNGNTPWTPGAPTVSGTGFSTSAAVTPATIAPSQNGTIDVTFAPTASGQHTGSISFASASPMPIDATLPYNFSAMATSSAGVTLRTSQDGFTLGASYPNPTSNSANVSVTLPHAARVVLVLVRADGSEVSTAFDGMLGEGQHALSLDTRSVPSGTYFCMLRSGSVHLIRELVVLR